MKTKLQINSIFTLILLVLLFHFISIKSQEVDDERAFDYIEGSKLGPEKWGELNPNWASCKTGKMQSPIDISNRVVPATASNKELVKRNYKAQNAIVSNRGHDLMIQWEGDVGSVLINGREFGLLQAHWHSPSEHTINGTRYSMEFHLVHRSIDPKFTPTIVVIAHLYEIGNADPFLSQLAPNMSSLIDRANEHKQVGVINPMEIHQENNECYYKYIGSLTTPSCTEGVIWIINKRISTVSSDQVNLLRDAVHDYATNNARPIQPLNNREVQLYCSRG